MSPPLHDAIQDELSAVEAREDVFVFYACESGSRAWGFESKDSDYDVRFLYVHKPEWYLSIDPGRDVLELPITDLMDYSGWDLKKALQLLRKSNPPFFEWIQSPIVYREDRRITELIREALPSYYSPTSCFHHYLHMARGNFRDYLQGEEVWLKKYLYILRPLLACLWIERGMGLVPTEFGRLVDSIVAESELRQALDLLLSLKKSGAELDKGPRMEVLSCFIEKELARLTAAHSAPKTTVDTKPLNDIFRKALQLAWGNTLDTKTR
jgi:predicted nucleotidyltransferase